MDRWPSSPAMLRNLTGPLAASVLSMSPRKRVLPTPYPPWISIVKRLRSFRSRLSFSRIVGYPLHKDVIFRHERRVVVMYEARLIHGALPKIITVSSRHPGDSLPALLLVHLVPCLFSRDVPLVQ